MTGGRTQKKGLHAEEANNGSPQAASVIRNSRCLCCLSLPIADAYCLGLLQSDPKKKPTT